MDLLEPYPYVTKFKGIDYPERVREWKYDTDFDDLFDMAKELDDGTLTINIEYRTISNILLCLYGNISVKQNSVIQDYIQEAIEQDIEPEDAMNSQLNNIVYLYNELNNFNVAGSSDLPIALYRGFRTGTALPLFDRLRQEGRMEIGSALTIPMFMSTSMIEETSLRFTGDEYILWKIIVPRDKMSIFKYTNISDQDYDILGNFDLFNSEAEILLNIGTSLKCIDIINGYTRNYRYPNANGTFGIKEKKCTLYIYEFQGNEDLDIVKYLRQLH